MTSNPESTLGHHADIILQLPKVSEACPNNLAPTTSTTMMIAYGDALAVVLLKQTGMTKEEFRIFHPGGKLGQRLLKVQDLMVGYDDLPLVHGDIDMAEAIVVMSEKNLGCLVVIDENMALAGIVTDGDLKRHMSKDLLEKSVSEIMSADPMNIQSSALAVEAIDKMTRTDGQYLTSLVVMDGESLSGLIRLQDCLRAGLL